jgi:DNA polymerase-1
LTRCGRTGRHLAFASTGQAAYIPLGHRQGGGDLFGGAALVEGQLDLDETLAALKPVLEDPRHPQDRPEHEIRLEDLARHGIRSRPSTTRC